MPSSLRLTRALPTLLTALLGPLAASLSCGDEGPAGGAGGASAAGGSGGIDASQLPYEPCAADALVGQFVVELGAGFTSVDGQVSDAVRVSLLPGELARDGECRLLRRLGTTCAPACPVALEECGPDAVCVALPRTRDVGAVSVRGLVAPMTIEPNDVTHRYANPALPPLPHPGFLPGADLRIDTEGGDYSPFQLRGWGVSPLVLSSEVIDVRRGQPVQLGWQAPADPGPARVNVELNINVHGSSSAWIECDFPDSGAAEIGAGLVDSLFEQGLSGNPTLTATRRSATSSDIEPGCVEMLVASQVSTPVQVEGVVSCRTSSECPPPRQCLSVERYCQ